MGKTNSVTASVRQILASPLTTVEVGNPGGLALADDFYTIAAESRFDGVAVQCGCDLRPARIYQDSKDEAQ
jgi:hypothetical protein